MEVSVVVATLNGRTKLARCLDALSDHAPSAEVVVVNGPSTDGTTGMVRDRPEVDVLVEIADRNLNVARNAGCNRTTGEWIAFVGDEYAIESGWLPALSAATGVEDEPASRSRFARVLTEPLSRVAGALTGSARTVRDRLPTPFARDPGDESAPGTIETTEVIDENENGPVLEPAGAVTGPVHRELTGGRTTEFADSRTIAGRTVTHFNADNVAFSRDAIENADGFDESLLVGGARDLAHRLAADGVSVRWSSEMGVASEYSADGTGRDPRSETRSLAYRLVKNYGLRPGIARRVLARAGHEVLASTRSLIRGERTPSEWFGGVRDVLWGSTAGAVSGLRARWGDRKRHNPNGLSARADRAIEVYDRR